MTCQHCQTWILDVEHRCRRCGRRVRSTPPRISPATYPIAAAATAPAYDFSAQQETEEEYLVSPSTQGNAWANEEPGQQPLFSQGIPEPRVIPFENLTSAEERESIRERAAKLMRPAPLRNAKVEAPHVRPQKRSKDSGDQRRFEFQGEEQVLSQPKASIICDALVAPAQLRFWAAMVDGAIILAGCAICVALYCYAGGPIALDRHALPFLLLSLLTVPLAYKLIWTFAGQDTIGMQQLGLKLVDFDGNMPSKGKRYIRLFGSLVSLLAAGIGLLWTFVDEDTLAWHDHMSNTFPTVASEN